MKFKQAVDAANARRSSINTSLLSRIRNGNLKQVSENPGALVDALVFSDGKVSAPYARSVLSKLPEADRESVKKAAFSRIFERARESARSAVDRSVNRYDAEAVARDIFGTKNQMDVAREVLGEEKLGLLRNWVEWNAAIAVESAKSSKAKHAAARVLSVSPYPRLLGARLASGAMEGAAGGSVLASAGPETIALFNQARLSALHPNKTAASISLVQKAIEHPAYGNYLRMMQPYTPEQQQAIDEYLTGLSDR
jgi:hypothetical protein